MQQHQARHIGHASLPLSIYTIYKAQSTLEPHLGQTYSSTGQGAHQARISASQHIYDIQSTKHNGATPWADMQQHRARHIGHASLPFSIYAKHKAHWSHTLGRRAAAPSKAHQARISASQQIYRTQTSKHAGATPWADVQQHRASHTGHASLPLSIYTIYKAQSTLEPHLGQTCSSTGQGAQGTHLLLGLERVNEQHVSSRVCR